MSAVRKNAEIKNSSVTKTKQNRLMLLSFCVVSGKTIQSSLKTENSIFVFNKF